MKKFLAILSLVIVFSLSVFSVCSSAQGIYNNASTFDNENALLSPKLYSVLRAVENNGSYDIQDRGAAFEVAPRFKTATNLLPQNVQVSISSSNAIIANEIPSYLKLLQHNFNYEYISEDYGSLFYQTFYLARKSNVQTTDKVYTQVSFSNFIVKYDVLDDYTPWSFTMYDTLSKVANVSITYAISTEDAIEYHTINTTTNSNYVRAHFDYNDLIYFIQNEEQNNSAYRPLEIDGYIHIKSLTFYAIGDEGYCRVSQFENSPEIVVLADGQSFNEKSMPNFLGWLVKAVGGFLATPIFYLGNVPVTFGTLLAIPIIVLVLVAFLKKFAGG